jgi:DNA-binding HxlR family transcriptional regulator
METKPALPGEPVRGSSSGRPIMALLDLLGRRWVLRILWELRGEALAFRPLQAACDGVSPSVLNQRLRELRQAHLIVRSADGYTLTLRGLSLLKLFTPINQWAEDWAKELHVSKGHEPEADDSHEEH